MLLGATWRWNFAPAASRWSGGRAKCGVRVLQQAVHLPLRDVAPPADW